MRLLRVGPVGSERPAVLHRTGTVLDLSGETSDIGPDFLADGGIARVQAAVAGGELAEIEEPGRIGAPLHRPGKIVCIGLNYSDHAAETGASAPSEPVLFMKDPATVVGPEDDVLIPRGSVKTDWEVELGVVIGRTVRYLGDDLSDADVLAHVAGYAVSHDVSEREFQLERGGTWDKGKSCETFNPLGPWLVTPDEVGDPTRLGLRTWVNGTLCQDGNTQNMIFDVVTLLRYLSRFMVLYPGDLVNTGTPAGVAMGRPEPKPYLRAGDVVELEIDGLGRQRQGLVQA